MADKKISQLTALAAANLAPSTDVLAIVDTSATETKKIVAQDLINGVLNVASAVGIGTASPAQKLDVNGVARVSTEIRVKNTAGNVSYLTFEENGNGNSATFISGDARTTGNMGFWTNSTQRMTLDSSGNLGLGVTPSLWGAGSQAMQNGGGSLFQYNNDRVFIGQNNYIDTSFADKFIGNGYATRYRQYQGTHAFFVSTASNSSGAGASASFTQAMTLDASGNLAVGTTTVDEILRLNGSSNATARIRLQNQGTTLGWFGSYLGITALGNGNDLFVANATNNALIFGTNGTERARITSGGDLLVGTTTSQGKFTVEASGGVLGLITTNATVGSGTRYHAVWYESGVEKGSVTSNGTNTAYNTSSDRRLKENISLADDAGAIIDAIQVVKHDWKNGGHTRFGVIAQDLNSVAPEAVNAGDDGEEIQKTWGVDYSKLVPMLVKEIQSLRSRVAALEAK